MSEAAASEAATYGSIPQPTPQPILEDKGARKPVTTAIRRANRATPVVSAEELAACVSKGHSTRPGRNAYSVFITCKTCNFHMAWLRDGVPTFRNFAELTSMEEHWVALRTTIKPSTSSAAGSSTFG